MVLAGALTHQQLKLRLQTLLDKKKVMQSHGYRTSKLSGNFMALQEGFQQFGNDLNKLQVIPICALMRCFWSKGRAAIRRGQCYGIFEDSQESKLTRGRPD